MSEAPPPIAGSTVLIADDNPQILELLEAYLEPLALRVVKASDGKDALDAVERENPDLILLDVMMPRVSGFEVCRKLKSDEHRAGVPVIMVTALNELGDIERARDCGADEFISKPVNKIELTTRVQELLRMRKSHAGS